MFAALRPLLDRPRLPSSLSPSTRPSTRPATSSCSSSSSSAATAATASTHPTISSLTCDSREVVGAAFDAVLADAVTRAAIDGADHFGLPLFM